MQSTYESIYEVDRLLFLLIFNGRICKRQITRREKNAKNKICNSIEIQNDIPFSFGANIFSFEFQKTSQHLTCRIFIFDMILYRYWFIILEENYPK